MLPLSSSFSIEWIIHFVIWFGTFILRANANAQKRYFLLGKKKRLIFYFIYKRKHVSDCLSPSYSCPFYIRIDFVAIFTHRHTHAQKSDRVKLYILLV